MEIQVIIGKLNREIGETFGKLYACLLEDEMILNFRIRNDHWTIKEILEHVSLTNHYLLILIRKGTKKAIRKKRLCDLEKSIKSYDFFDPDLQMIADDPDFSWESPSHMIPAGKKTEEIDSFLRVQQLELEDIMKQLHDGAGMLHKTTMRVYQLGKLDVYQYIYFLLLHIRRHLKQIERIKMDFESRSGN